MSILGQIEFPTALITDNFVTSVKTGLLSEKKQNTNTVTFFKHMIWTPIFSLTKYIHTIHRIMNLQIESIHKISTAFRQK